MRASAVRDSDVHDVPVGAFQQTIAFVPAVEGSAAGVVVEALVLETDLVRRIRAVESIRVTFDADGMLLHRTRESCTHDDSDHAHFGVAAAGVVGRPTLGEELTHHRAPTPSSSGELVEDLRDAAERRELPP
jgi:hypothetical protein